MLPSKTEFQKRIMYMFINDTLESKKRVDMEEQGYVYLPIKVKEVIDDLYKVYEQGFIDGKNDRE
jgi:hypothetical protein